MALAKRKIQPATTSFPLRFKKQHLHLLRRLDEEAQRNCRSRNAEIVHRLAESFVTAPG